MKYSDETLKRTELAIQRAMVDGDLRFSDALKAAAKNVLEMLDEPDRTYTKAERNAAVASGRAFVRGKAAGLPAGGAMEAIVEAAIDAALNTLENGTEPTVRPKPRLSKRSQDTQDALDRANEALARAQEAVRLAEAARRPEPREVRGSKAWDLG